MTMTETHPIDPELSDLFRSVFESHPDHLTDPAMALDSAREDVAVAARDQGVYVETDDETLTVVVTGSVAPAPSERDPLALPDEWTELPGISASYRAEGPDAVRISLEKDLDPDPDYVIASVLEALHGSSWKLVSDWSEASGEPDVTAVFERAPVPVFAIGDHVEGSEPGSQDYDWGTVVAVDGDQVEVVWEGSLVLTTQPASILRPGWGGREEHDRKFPFGPDWFREDQS